MPLLCVIVTLYSICEQFAQFLLKLILSRFTFLVTLHTSNRYGLAEVILILFLMRLIR